MFQWVNWKRTKRLRVINNNHSLVRDRKVKTHAKENEELRKAVEQEVIYKSYNCVNDVVRYLESAGLHQHFLTVELRGLVWAENERSRCPIS